MFSENLDERLLEYYRRQEFAAHAVRKLKLRTENGAHRLEITLCPELELLAIAVFNPIRLTEQVIGALEIDGLSTLADLRPRIAAEMDLAMVPQTYRFLFRVRSCYALLWYALLCSALLCSALLCSTVDIETSSHSFRTGCTLFGEARAHEVGKGRTSAACTSGTASRTQTS
jgi:hypothetical protein